MIAIRRIVRIRSVLVILAALFAATFPMRKVLAADIQSKLGGVASWHYQLQNIDVAVLSQLDVGLIVIDYARSSPEGPPVELSRDEVERLRTKPDGGRRIVLAYLSIGEAEEYRFYWKAEFAKVRPAWYFAPNKRWPDNHRVRFWMDDWKEIIVRRAGSYLDRIQDAGFDGVYLDRIDTYGGFAIEQPDARSEMIALIREIADKARHRHPDFLIIAQNAEALLEHAPYRAIIDGIAKEDYVFGVGGDGRRNAADLVQWTADKLQLLKADGKLVLVVEYLSDPIKQADARFEIERGQFIHVFARRALDGPAVELRATTKMDDPADSSRWQIRVPDCAWAVDAVAPC